MSGGRHCYPDSETLVNKYHIRDKELLEKLEIQKVGVKLLGLDVNLDRVSYTFDTEHLMQLHEYLFGDIYEWAGTIRDENIFKSERVLSGGSAEYADYKDITEKLTAMFEKYQAVDWQGVLNIADMVSEFLLELWTIHPFREGNTRTCVTFLWHYLKGRGIDFRLELLKNNPMYVRDSLVMANYDQKQYNQKIVSDALSPDAANKIYKSENTSEEQYQIAQTDYEAFREKYTINKKNEIESKKPLKESRGTDYER
ncbi:MAG: Fic family protein [Peptococcaceae bacterium]|nr:Fic family protein [Peptococcaceae bacterium]